MTPHFLCGSTDAMPCWWLCLLWCINDTHNRALAWNNAVFEYGWSCVHEPYQDPPSPSTPLSASHAFPSPVVMYIYVCLCLHFRYFSALFMFTSQLCESPPLLVVYFFHLISSYLKVLHAATLHKWDSSTFPFQSGRTICRKQVRTNLLHEKKQLKDLD